VVPVLVAVLAACAPTPPTARTSPAGAARPATSTASGARPVDVAPWLDVTGRPAPGATDLAAVVRQGVRTVNLAFVTAAAGECTPSWGGTTAIDDPPVAQLIEALGDAGAEVRVSFGGADGVELAGACPTSAALAAAYAHVLDTLGGVRLVDLDVEAVALQDAAAVQRRNEALRRLEADAEKRGRALEISYTLPAESTGLTPPAQALLRNARNVGLEPAVVDVLAMNYADPPADLVAAGDGAIDAARSFVASVWVQGPPRIAATVMIGVNDIRAQVLSAPDAGRFAATARQRSVAWLGYWSLGRDRPCPGGPAVLSPSCSGTAEPAGAFLDALTRSAGAAPAG
jgi:hypothetical protein